MKKTLNQILGLWEIVKKRVLTYLDKHEYIRVGLTYFAIGMLFYASKSIPNWFTLPMNGDYVLQQLPFYVEGYDKIWHFLTTGEFPLWSYENFVGVNYFAANTFYYLTSPFLLPMLFVPRNLMPQMIFIMMIVKFTVGGLSLYALFRRYFNVSKDASFIGGLIYGFGGWAIFYLWFNHFSDVLALFPLTFMGVEHLLKYKKGWLLTLSMVLLGMANYFYLFAFSITTGLYFLARYFQRYNPISLYLESKRWKMVRESLMIMFTGLFSMIIGILMVGVILYPSFLIVIDTPRVTGTSLLIQFLQFFFLNPQKTDAGYVLGTLKDWTQFLQKANIDGLINYLFVWDEKSVSPALQTLFYPIAQWLYPTSANFDSLLFKNTSFDNTISSLYVTIPIAMLLWHKVINIFKSLKSWNIFLLLVAFALPFIPFTYYILHAFTIDYGRWQLFLIVVMLIVVIPELDHLDKIPRWHIDVGFIINILLAGGVAYYAYSIGKLDMQYRVWIVLISLLYTVFIYIFMRVKAKGPGFIENLNLIVVIELFVATTITLNIHGVANYATLYGGQNILAEQQAIIDELKTEDTGFYRIYNSLADRSYPNLPMVLGYNGLSTFHSVYDFYLFDFINSWSKVSYSYSNWAMGIHEKRYNLDTFLNVKYYLLHKEDTNIPLGFHKVKETSHFALYQNDNFIELGYAYDNIISYNDFNVYRRTFDYEAGYLEAAVIEEADFDEVSGALQGDVTVLNSTHDTFRSVPSPDLYVMLRGENPVMEPINLYYNIKDLVPEERLNGSDFNFYGRWIERGWAGDKIILQYPSNLCENMGEGCHMIVNFAFGPNAEISLYNDDTLITKDSHMVHNYDKSGDFKTARGFYVSEPFNKVVVEFINDAPYSTALKYGLSLYYEPYSTYKERIDVLAENAFSNVEHTVNTASFDTNYADKKMLVLSIPYDEGWSLTINGEPTKLYQVTGGFLGAVAPSGPAHYELKYLTPGLETGGQLTWLGIFIFALWTTFVERRRIIGWFKHK